MSQPDPVEALAIVLWKAWRPDPYIAVHDWSEIRDLMREPFRNMARAALAFARKRVPGVEELAEAINQGHARALVLARLGGEGTT